MIDRSTKCYFDIDGTLIHESLRRAGEPADGLAEFLRAIAKYPVYWLTTHCMDGNPEHARTKLRRVTPPDVHPIIDAILPTTWRSLKTEAIDFSGPFLWLENDVFGAEREILRTRATHDGQFLVEVDLDGNASRLREVIAEYFL